MNLYKKILIINWINNKTYNTYENYVYEDDNLETAIIKLAKNIYNTDKFYAWKADKSILFNFKSINWDGYSPNNTCQFPSQSSPAHQSKHHRKPYSRRIHKCSNCAPCNNCRTLIYPKYPPNFLQYRTYPIL